jgi:hypothetical protein
MLQKSIRVCIQNHTRFALQIVLPTTSSYASCLSLPSLTTLPSPHPRMLPLTGPLQRDEQYVHICHQEIDPRMYSEPHTICFANRSTHDFVLCQLSISPESHDSANPSSSNATPHWSITTRRTIRSHMSSGSHVKGFVPGRLLREYWFGFFLDFLSSIFCLL